MVLSLSSYAIQSSGIGSDDGECGGRLLHIWLYATKRG
jgi:hypothetical protein